MIRHAEPPVEQSPAIEPLALKARDAAAAIGISERKLWAMTKAGEVPHVRLGGGIVYPVDALREWLADLVTPAAEQPPPRKTKAAGDRTPAAR